MPDLDLNQSDQTPTKLVELAVRIPAHANINDLLDLIRDSGAVVLGCEVGLPSKPVNPEGSKL